MSGIATNQSAIAIGFCFPIIGGTLVGLRFYTRWHQKVGRYIDDWLCIPAWLCLTGCCASILTGVFKNAFVEAPVTGPDDVTKQERLLAQVTAALVIFWMGANALIKLSVLFFYRRIFVGKVFSIFNWVLIGLSILWFIYAVLSWLLYCGTNLKADFEGGWLACAPWGFDIQMGVFCLDSFIDFCLLLLPIPFVWKLQLDRKRRFAVLAVFLLGSFAFVAGLINTIIQLVYLTKPSLVASSNFFQGSSLLFSNWPAVEIGVGLIACNLPSLSFRIAHSLPSALRRGFDLSWSGIQQAAAAITLRSGASRRSRDRSSERSRRTNSRDNSGNVSSENLHKQSSGTSGSEEIQLADLPAASEPRTTREDGYKIETVRGFNAV